MTGLRKVSLSVLLLSLACGVTYTARSVKAAHNPTGNANGIDQAVQIMNGTWKLVKRTNPDGSEHSKIDGVTAMSLDVVHSKQLGARAVGKIEAREKGDSLDARFGSCVPEEARNKPFLTESVGTWSMKVESETKDEAILNVVQSHYVIANYRPYIDGLEGDVYGRYRVHKNAAPGEVQLQLIGTLQFDDPKTPPRIIPTALKGSGSPQCPTTCSTTSTDTCCTVAANGFTVSGNTMKITWSNGGSDVWVRTSSSFDDGAFNKR